MRLWLALSFCLVPCLPAAARDLTVSAAWETPANAELVTVLYLPDGTIATTLRHDITDDTTTLDQLLVEIPRQATSVQSALIDDTRILAQSARKLIERIDTSLDLTLFPVLALSLRSVFDCADLGIARLSTTAQVTRLSLSRNGAEVARLLAADGRLSAPDGTTAQVTGSTLTLTAPDGTQILCPALPAPPLLPVTARALDGTWEISMDTAQANVTLPPGALTEGEAIAPVGAGQLAGGTILFSSPQFTLTLRAARCLRGSDTVPYPLSARLALAGGADAADGCAGNPLDLLAGQPWSVTSVLGIPVGQELTLGFGAGQVSGRGTCNLYQARVGFEAGRMALSNLGTTRVGCATSLRNLELRFLDALEGANGFDLGADGTLILRVGPMPVLTARQNKSAP